MNQIWFGLTPNPKDQTFEQNTCGLLGSTQVQASLENNVFCGLKLFKLCGQWKRLVHGQQKRQYCFQTILYVLGDIFLDVPTTSLSEILKRMLCIVASSEATK